MNTQIKTKSMSVKTPPKTLTVLKALLKPSSPPDKVGQFLKKTKPGTLGPDAMELMVKADMISTATSYTDRFAGMDAALARQLIKSRQMLGNFNSHSFVDLPKAMLGQIMALTGGLSVARVNLATFKEKDQEAVMDVLVTKYKDDALLNIAQQLGITTGLTNKMAVKLMKYLPQQNSKYFSVVCQNINSYPPLNKQQFKKDLEKHGLGLLTKKYSKHFEV